MQQEQPQQKKKRKNSPIIIAPETKAAFFAAFAAERVGRTAVFPATFTTVAAGARNAIVLSGLL